MSYFFQLEYCLYKIVKLAPKVGGYKLKTASSLLSASGAEVSISVLGAEVD